MTTPSQDQKTYMAIACTVARVKMMGINATHVLRIRKTNTNQYLWYSKRKKRKTFFFVKLTRPGFTFFSLNMNHIEKIKTHTQIEKIKNHQIIHTETTDQQKPLTRRNARDKNLSGREKTGKTKKETDKDHPDAKNTVITRLNPHAKPNKPTERSCLRREQKLAKNPSGDADASPRTHLSPPKRTPSLTDPTRGNLQKWGPRRKMRMRWNFLRKLRGSRKGERGGTLCVSVIPH